MQGKGCSVVVKGFELHGFRCRVLGVAFYVSRV